jgi:type IV pilus assembly protein PilV
LKNEQKHRAALQKCRCVRARAGARQRGSSMIEILISLVLVAVVMLGLMGLQLRSLGFQKDSLDRRAAAVLVGAFADRVTANYAAFRDARYDDLGMGPADGPPVSAAVTACTASAACTPVNAAARDWDLFRIEVRNRLPGGVAFVNSTAAVAEITVGWVDPQRTNVEVGGTNVADAACAAVGVTDARYRCYVARVSP